MMRKLTVVSAIFILMFVSGMVNEIQAQTEFATVRLVTTWGKDSHLFITRGSGETEQMELKQGYADKKQDKEYSHDNKIINSVFEVLYADGYRLVSTASTDQPGGGFVSAGREVIYLLVRE